MIFFFLKKIKILFTLFIFIIFFLFTKAQKKQINVVAVFKSISSDFIFNPSKNLIKGDSVFSIENKYSYSLGGLLKIGISDFFFVESGIHFTQRNYRLNFVKNKTHIENIGFRIISYELPIRGTIVLQLGRLVYMSSSLGILLEFFPSDVASFGKNIIQESVRTNWIKAGIGANIGFEYKIPKNGRLYWGISVHQLLGNTYKTKVGKPNALYTNGNIKLFTNYFSFLDIRYYFDN